MVFSVDKPYVVGNNDSLEDFCHLSDDKHARLSSVERMTLQGGEELERFFTRLSKDAMPLNFAPLIAGLDNNILKITADFYGAFENPFVAPSGVFVPKIIPVHGLSSEGEIIDVEYESAYQGLHESYSKIESAIPENKTVRVRVWKHANHESRPTLIAVPGWTMGDPKINALTFMPGYFFRLGCNVAIFELPFHGRRLTSEFRDIGHSVFPSANLFLTNEAVLQGISDLRQLRLILRALGFKNIGALGISLGSYLTATWATIEPLHFLINLLPFFNMGNVAEAALEKEGDITINRPLLGNALKVHSSIDRTSKTKAVQFILMSDDAVIPKEEVLKGKDIFPMAKIAEFSGGHEIASSRGSVVETIEGFLKPFL